MSPSAGWWIDGRPGGVGDLDEGAVVVPVAVRGEDRLDGRVPDLGEDPLGVVGGVDEQRAVGATSRSR
jgi:hypothetical protein